ncbi:exosortase B [Paucibacter sp. R3-3]|uniref:Exosortase B n=1 Tax=Roseateles agri TaxID=3098619 RepID=A0ABU5DC56_9BURK|nr:exosortase B [Paucibacter sp. R3-3]MDY0743861.1 exosortase B [Paucibacter sp. R3-3]
MNIDGVQARTSTMAQSIKPVPWLPDSLDRVAAAAVLVGMLLMYVPTYIDLSETVWRTDEQGHGPIILAVSLWLIFNARHKLAELSSPGAPWLGYPLLVLGCFAFAVGYSQDVWLLGIGSQIVVLAAIALIFKGPAGLRTIWFPLFFLIFMIPLPSALVAAVTAPLKSAVSVVASSLLYDAGYPVGRSGVTLTVGQYQLLVADACAGLNSMFTLEALGMLYMNLMQYKSVGRNVALALALIPTAFVANVVRVIILVLVTYYFGDEAGQGFVHGFAGMVLFLVALMFMLLYDRVLNFFFVERRVVAV